MVMRMKELNKTFVLQHDASDCGVACLLSIIRYYGGSTTLQYLRELSGTTKQGTTLLGLYQAAGQVGFDAKGCETDILSLKEHGSPVILHLVLDGKFEHYMVCYGFKDGYFIMGGSCQRNNHLYRRRTGTSMEISRLSYSCVYKQFYTTERH